MLGRSRVAGSLDVARAGEALARPGMDTRVWASLAVVDAVRVDKDLGIVCDITLMPGEQTEVARVGTEYAGAGWGLFFPVYPDDEVLVVAPGGDPNAGLVITRRLHSPSAPLPDQATANPDDAVLVAKSGQSFRAYATSGGTVHLDGDGEVRCKSGSKVVLDTGTVKLGGDAATSPVIKGDAYDQGEVTFEQAWNSALSTLNTAAADPSVTLSKLAQAIVSYCGSMSPALTARATARKASLSKVSTTE